MYLDLYWEKIFPLIRLSGEGTRKFLHGQTSNNVLNKKDGEIFLSCWLSTSGKVRGIFEIILNPDAASLLVIGGDDNEVKEAFNSMIFPSDKVSIQSTHSIRRLQVINSNLSSFLDNIIWLEPNSNLPINLHSFQKATELEVEAWRLAKGLPIGAFEINQSYNPFELGLSEIVSLDKGCYLGQESIAKLSRAGSSRKKLMLWSSKFMAKVNEPILSYVDDQDFDQKAGLVTSSIYLPSEERSIGLAIMNKNFLSSNSFYLNSLEKKVEISAPKLSFNNWLSLC